MDIQNEIPDSVAWQELLKANESLSIRLNDSENKLDKIVRLIESELKEIPKLQDFASGHGDAEGYARVCGQDVLLKRLYEKVERIIRN